MIIYTIIKDCVHYFSADEQVTAEKTQDKKLRPDPEIQNALNTIELQYYEKAPFIYR